VFTGIDVLLAVRPLSTLFNLVPRDARLFQAAIGVTSSYDALLELFGCLGSFLKRLEIYMTIPPTMMMTDIVVKIMVQVLSVLALATKLIKDSRLSKCAFICTPPLAQCATEMYFKKLFGDSEVEAALQNLDRLTTDEARMAVAQTLGVVHSLVGNVREVMESTQCLHNLLLKFF
jgi:hypothetical protein